MINYKVGDLFEAIKKVDKDKRVIVAHCCNNKGLFGSGFVIPLAKYFPEVKDIYLDWHKNGEYEHIGGSKIKFQLGENQEVGVNEKLCVVNMIGQNGCISKENPKPISYEAIDVCFLKLSRFLNMFKWLDQEYELHFPALGSKRAGGCWKKISDIINKHLPDDVVNIYTLNQQEKSELLSQLVLRKKK